MSERHGIAPFLKIPGRVPSLAFSKKHVCFVENMNNK